jgi:uncharacterized protein YbdZ (MbtH family)
VGFLIRQQTEGGWSLWNALFEELGHGWFYLACKKESREQAKFALEYVKNNTK